MARPTSAKRTAKRTAKPDERGPTVDDVRALALALPETVERPSYGTPGFRVKDKLFARVLEDGESIVIFIDPDERDARLASAPEIFSVTPHYQGSPMVIVRLTAVTRPVLRTLLESSWRRRAPLRLAAAHARRG